MRPLRAAKAIKELVKGKEQISDSTELAHMVAQVIADNPEQVDLYLAGKETVAQWLMGQVMRASQGTANAQVVQELLAEQLSALKK